jgi:hypothetical protein
MKSIHVIFQLGLKRSGCKIIVEKTRFRSTPEQNLGRQLLRKDKVVFFDYKRHNIKSIEK